MRPSGYLWSTFSTLTVQPALTMPSSLDSTIPTSLSSRIAIPIISLYRSSKICNGRRVRGKTTKVNGNRGSSRAAMLILWREARACRRFRPMRIEGKVVLITGASEGIGAACAAEFAASGAKLALNARNLEKLSQAAPKDAAETLLVPGDVTLDSD